MHKSLRQDQAECIAAAEKILEHKRNSEWRLLHGRRVGCPRTTPLLTLPIAGTLQPWMFTNLAKWYEYVY